MLKADFIGLSEISESPILRMTGMPSVCGESPQGA
nr:MAG TPA: hypothetical protein [Caudoviricetes sp.]